MVQPLFSAFGLKACFRAWGAAMAMLLLVASCTQDLPGDDGNGDAAISFSAPAVTRAAVESFQTGDAFSVWGWYDNQGAIGNPFSSETVTNNGSAWSYTGGLRYWVLDATYDFYAVYPSSVKAECDEQGHITVTDFDASATGDDAVDLMTAKALDITYATADDIQPVGLEFEHLLAKVNIMVESQGGTANITSAKLSGIQTSGDYDSSATTPWTLDATTHEFTASGTTANQIASSLFGDLLLPPQQVGTFTFEITYSYGGSTPEIRSVSLPADVVTQWEAGKSYTYTLTLTSDYIIFGMPAVNEWGEASGGIIIVD